MTTEDRDRWLSEVSPRVQEALAILAAGELIAERLPEGLAKVRALIREMDDHRQRRLLSAGFSEAQAAEISELHTPNFMWFDLDTGQTPVYHSAHALRGAATLMKTLNPQAKTVFDAGSAFCPCVWPMPCPEMEARVR